MRDTTSQHVRCLAPPSEADWNIEGCFFGSSHSSDTYVTNAVDRAGILTFAGNKLESRGAGDLLTAYHADKRALMACATRDKRQFFGSGAAPSTTTVEWRNGDEWHRTDATAGTAAVWQNTGTDLSDPTWKVLATLAS